MTNQSLTSINVIIDESPSMGSLRDSTISGFNAFLKEQKLQPGDCRFSLTKFHGHVNLIHDQVAISDVQELTRDSYKPSGSGTALLDAMGVTIDATGRALAALPEEQRPGKVIFVVMTDGEENMSREYSLEKIQQMVKHQSDVYSWEFVFMGAGIDAFGAGVSLGIRGGNTFSYTHDAQATRDSYVVLSSNMNMYRSAMPNVNADFFAQQTSDSTSDTPENK